MQCGDVWSVASARAAGARAGRRGWGRDAGAWSLCGWAQIRGSRWLSGFYGSCGVRIDAAGACCVRAASSVHARVCAVLSRSGQHRGEGRRHFCNNFKFKLSVCLSVCLLVHCDSRQRPVSCSPKLVGASVSGPCTARGEPRGCWALWRGERGSSCAAVGGEAPGGRSRLARQRVARG